MERILCENTVCDMVYLASCAANGVSPDDERLHKMDLDAIFRLSQWHLLTATCAVTLERAGIRERHFVQERAKALRKVALMDIERAELFHRLDEHGVWYVPLKGCVLQEIYPVYGMREMSDNDILFDAQKALIVKTILESMQFRCESFGYGAHDIYKKDPVCNFELHRMLFTPIVDEKVFKYYENVEEILVSDGRMTCRHHLTNNDLYVYLVAHEYKHFSSGGTGLRSLLDIYVFLQKRGEELDWNYITQQMTLLDLVTFEQNNRRLALALFSGGDLSQEDKRFLDYIVDSGAYGTLEHAIMNQVTYYGMWGFLIHKTLPSFQVMKTHYPVLENVPILLPIMWSWRLLSAMVIKPVRILEIVRAFCMVMKEHDAS